MLLCGQLSVRLMSCFHRIELGFESTQSIKTVDDVLRTNGWVILSGACGRLSNCGLALGHERVADTPRFLDLIFEFVEFTTQFLGDEGGVPEI